MSLITSIETVSEPTHQLHSLHDVQHLFDRILQSDHLFINRDLLRSTYIPEILPHREQEITELANILSPALDYAAPSNVIMYGLPGIGKTAVAKYVGAELEAAGKAHGKNITFLYVNCQLVNTLHKILYDISSHISNNHNILTTTGFSSDVVLSKITTCLDATRQVLILCLDEADRIKDDHALYTLTRINEHLHQSRVSIILVSNDIFFTESFDSRIKSSLNQEIMVFDPYNADQLQDILRARIKTALKPGVIEEDVIPLCSALSAQEHGDARRALDLLRVAVELAERKHDHNVTNKHVRLAQSKIEKDRIAEVIHSLPGQQRLLLHAIRILHRYNDHMGKQSVMITGEIYNQYVELSKIVRYTPLTPRRVADFISQLETLGILTARVISKGRHGQTKEIQLTMPLAELAHILNDDEFTQEFQQVKMKNQMKLL